jgi:Ras-related protein Rab-32
MSGGDGNLLKILVLGDTATGKTSFIKRYVHNSHSKDHKATVGVDFVLKQLQVNKKSVRLQMWDIAGQDRFGAIARVYYKDAKGALLLYDITRKDSYDNTLLWKKEIDEKVRLPDGSRLPVLLVGNKSDLENLRQVPDDKDRLNEFVQENGFIGWFETSAKEGTLIHDAARYLVEDILKHDLTKKQSARSDSDAVRNSDIGSDSSTSGGGCPC